MVMELGLHPKRQRWYIERFILHGWPWGENSSQITPVPKGPLGLSIRGKLLLAAAYTRIFVTSLDDAGQQITIDWTVRVLRDMSHRKVLLCEVGVSAQMCLWEEELECINLHADDGAFSLLSILSDPIPWHTYTRPEGALILFVQ